MSAVSISWRTASRLSLFALVVASLLSLANSITRQTIATNAEQHLLDTLGEVLPANYFDNDPSQTAINVFDDTLQTNRTIYRATLNKQPSAAALTTTTTDGYAGPIKLLIGITYEGTVTGVRTLEHSETPGLGDDIEINKSDWILDFNGQSLNSAISWSVKRDGGDYDHFTGATITPRAVVRAVENTLQWYKDNRRILFNDL